MQPAFKVMSRPTTPVELSAVGVTVAASDAADPSPSSGLAHAAATAPSSSSPAAVNDTGPCHTVSQLSLCCSAPCRSPLIPRYLCSAVAPLEFVPPTDVTLLDQHRPGGSSDSIGLVTLAYSDKRFLAKADATRPVTPEDGPLKAFLKEICSNDMYAYFGCHAQRLAICRDLPWIVGTNCCKRDRRTRKWRDVVPGDGECGNPAKSHFVSECNGSHPFDPVREANTSSGPHLVTQWIEGFHPFDGSLTDALTMTVTAAGATPSSVESLTTQVELDGVRYTLPVRGLGSILAVGLLLNDIDCLHNQGANVGFTVVRDGDTGEPEYAKAIKIDPGYAFTGCGRCALDAQDVVLSIADRDVPIGTGRKSSFDKLPLFVQREFLDTMQSVVRCSDDEFRRLLTRPGLELSFSPADVEARVEFLGTRRDALATAYSAQLAQMAGANICPFCRLAHSTGTSFPITSCLKARYCESAKIRDPVTLQFHAIEDRFVNLSMLMGARTGRVLPAHGEVVETDSGAAASGGDLVLNSFESIRASKVPVDLGDLLGEIRHRDGKRVNLVGGAGIGKSTCCQAIVNCWAAGTLLKGVDVVLWIPLRNLTSTRYPSADTYTAQDIIMRECIGVQPNPILRMVVDVVYSTCPVMWILDGYDEIVGRIPDHLRSVFHEMATAKNRILTGRPNAMRNDGDAYLAHQ